MIGRRVENYDGIERAGDYWLSANVDVTGGRSIWFLLPVHEGVDRRDCSKRGNGLHRVSEPTWTFRECPDGSIEIWPSIACGRQDPGGEYWHGYLNEGHEWSST